MHAGFLFSSAHNIDILDHARPGSLLILCCVALFCCFRYRHHDCTETVSRSEVHGLGVGSFPLCIVAGFDRLIGARFRFLFDVMKTSNVYLKYSYCNMPLLMTLGRSKKGPLASSNSQRLQCKQAPLCGSTRPPDEAVRPLTVSGLGWRFQTHAYPVQASPFRRCDLAFPRLGAVGAANSQRPHLKLLAYRSCGQGLT
jgi:hypothetical protein